MSHLSQELQASGIARVIVFLNQEGAAEGTAKLQHLFSSSELSQAYAHWVRKHRKKKSVFADDLLSLLGNPIRHSRSSRDCDVEIGGRAVGGKTVGMAPGAMLASAIVVEGGDVVARVLGGMDWAVAKGIKILSMSLGFRGWWQHFSPLTKLLRARSVLPIFAAGNEGPGTSRSPGNYWQACSIGAVDRGRGSADFSSSQRFKRKKDPVVPDIVAPGVDIVSAKLGGGYHTMNGTSMATPHVAGLAALLWEAKPLATVDQIEQVIFRSCRRGPNMDLERGNRGIPIGPRALTLLKKS